MSTTARITYDEFDAMIRRGEFASTDDRFELLLGEICVMPLPDPVGVTLVGGTDVQNRGFPAENALFAGRSGAEPAVAAPPNPAGHPDQSRRCPAQIGITARLARRHAQRRPLNKFSTNFRDAHRSMSERPLDRWPLPGVLLP